MTTMEIADITLGGTTYRDVTMHVGTYATSGTPALWLESEGERLATVTVNVSTPGLFGKDYAENEGLLAQLVEQDLIFLTGASVTSGWVQVPEFLMMPAAAEALGIASLYVWFGNAPSPSLTIEVTKDRPGGGEDPFEGLRQFAEEVDGLEGVSANGGVAFRSRPADFILPNGQEIALSEIRDEHIYHARWHYGERKDAYEPGSFTRKLLELADVADHLNLTALNSAFPGPIGAALLVGANVDEKYGDVIAKICGRELG